MITPGNIEYREDGRSRNKFENDLKAGTSRSVTFSNIIVAYIDKMFKSGYIDYNIRVSAVGDNTTTVYGGHYEDEGDIKIRIGRRGYPKDVRYCLADNEICSNSNKTDAAIKETCLSRCINRSWAMIVVLHWPENTKIRIYDCGEGLHGIKKSYKYVDGMYEYGGNKGGRRVYDKGDFFRLIYEEDDDGFADNAKKINDQLKKLYEASHT